MTHYAIGDVQGCLDELERLLDRIAFNPQRDHLWLTGDLVNRGPRSADTVRRVMALGTACETVLGNHDLYLLAVAHGAVGAKPVDTFGDVLAAPDREALLDWLATRPLLVKDGSFAMVHAGLLPQWTLGQAEALAREVEQQLRTDRQAFLATMFGNFPARWSDDLIAPERHRVVVNAMTRMRVCTQDGDMEFTCKGEPEKAPPGFVPWFDVAGRRSTDHTIIFGHWSALGVVQRNKVIGLDSGCVWGRQLTAIRLDDGALFAVECPQHSALTD